MKLNKKKLNSIVKEEVLSFLNEGRTNSIGKEKTVEFVDPIVREFGDVYKAPEIYRGIKNDISFGLIRPSEHVRVSANTKNYYTLLIDNSKRWSEYPKRSKSVVCSTNKKKAGNYGQPFKVFPKIGSKIGVCPVDDIFYSFPRLEDVLGIRKMSDFNYFLEYIYEWVLGYSEELSETSFTKLKAQLNLIGESEKFIELYQTEKFKNNPEQKRLPSSIQDNIEKAAEFFFPNFNTFYEMIDHLLDPKKNGFNLVNYKKGLEMPKNKEVWISSDSVLIHTTLLQDVYHEFRPI